MGCCQSRDANDKKFHMENAIISQPTLHVDFHLIKGYYRNKAWHKLAAVVDNENPLICKERLLWAETPKTIGCLAVSYLARQALKDPQKVNAEIEKLIQFIIKAIKTGTDDLRENSLILLSGFVNSITDKQAMILVEQKAFNVLVRFFMCSKPEMRMMCARICNFIYTGRLHAQEAFLKENGSTLLLSLIQWNSSYEDKLSPLLLYLDNVILDSNRNPQPTICIRLKDHATWEILKQIRDKWRGHYIEEQVLYLTTNLFLL